jgi:hypothetical protein
MANPLRKFFLPKSKLFFPVGLLSLVFIPLLSFRLFLSDPYFHVDHVLEVTYFSKNMLEFLPINFPPSNKPIISISGNELERKQKVNSVLDEINYLQKTGIDSSEFQINLSDEATWDDYISILNIFHKKKLKEYIILGDKIWVYTDTSFRPKPKHERPVGIKPFEIPISNLWGHGDLLVDDLPASSDFDSSVPSSFQLFRNTRDHISFIGTCEVLLFAVLLLLNIYSVRKSFLSRKT